MTGKYGQRVWGDEGLACTYAFAASKFEAGEFMDGIGNQKGRILRYPLRMQFYLASHNNILMINEK